MQEMRRTGQKGDKESDKGGQHVNPESPALQAHYLSIHQGSPEDGKDDDKAGETRARVN